MAAFLSPRPAQGCCAQGFSSFLRASLRGHCGLRANAEGREPGEHAALPAGIRFIRKNRRIRTCLSRPRQDKESRCRHTPPSSENEGVRTWFTPDAGHRVSLPEAAGPGVQGRLQTPASPSPAPRQQEAGASPHCPPPGLVGFISHPFLLLFGFQIVYPKRSACRRKDSFLESSGNFLSLGFESKLGSAKPRG